MPPVPSCSGSNLPVTLFVPTSFPGRPGPLFWWDAIYRALMRTHQPQIEVPGLGVLAPDALRRTARRL